MEAVRSMFQHIRGELVENAPLATRTTYQIGGPARFLACPLDIDDLKRLNDAVQQHRLPHFVLGGGANVLVSDRGMDGVVVQLKHFDKLAVDGKRVSAGAGLKLDELVTACLRHSLAGLERLSGIPGTLGGALRMNAGAFESEISDHLLSVECLNMKGNLLTLDKEEVGFGYRNASKIRDAWILGATFQLPSGSVEQLFKIRQEILARRREKQPWQYPSAGSVFKRPPGRFVGLLIEEVGLKGKTIGRAQISKKHAGIIINLGGATAADVLALIRLAQTEVKNQFGVPLELEQELVGFESCKG